MSDVLLYESENLKEFCIQVLIKAGVKQDDADIISDTMISAELRGVKSHGLVRFPTYLERLEKGILIKNANMEFERKSGAVALLNAKNGFGQIAGYKAMSMAIELAQNLGIGMVGVKNSNHFGIAAYYSMMAADKGMIGIVLTHSSPAIAPYGTKTSLLGTNPLSISVPANHGKPIILDMATSMVARGKIRYAALKGEPIPEGWALDADGKPTTDSMEALKGTLVAIGGVKGSGLSLIIDILCGVLTDTCLTGEVKNVTDMSGPSHTGHTFCAINILHFIDEDLFRNNIDLIIDRIKGLSPIGDNKVYMPGEIEFDLTEGRKKNGIPVDYNVINQLNEIAVRYQTQKL